MAADTAWMRIPLAMLLACAAPLGAALGQAPTTPTLAGVLAAHTEALGGDGAVAGATEFVLESMEGEVRRRTSVRRQPFALRMDTVRPGAQQPDVRLSDGRRAFRLGPNGELQLLTGDDARLLIEAALLDGLLYLDGTLPGLRRIRGPLQPLAMPPGLPAAVRATEPVWPVAIMHPCGTEVRLYFDIDDGRLRGFANTGFVPQRNVRFGEWRAFGALTLPASRWENRGADPPVLVQITNVIVGPIDGQPFAALLPEPTGKAVDTSPLVLAATEVPGACYPLLPAVGIDRRTQVTGLFDTGAGRTYLDHRVADALRLPVVSQRRVNAIAGGTTTSQRWLEALELPRWQFVQVEIGATRLPLTIQDEFAAWPSVILGGEVRDHGPVLDLQRGVLQLRDTRPRALEGDNMLHVPLVGDGSQDLDEVAIEIDGKRLLAVLDTGMPVPLRLRPAGLRAVGLPLDAAAWQSRGALPIVTTGAGGGAATDLLVRLPSLRLGDIVLERPWVQIALDDGHGAADYAAAVGMGAFTACARIGLDRSRRRLELEPGPTMLHRDGAWHAPAPGAFLGLRAWLPEPPAQALGERLPVVVEVSPGSAAAAAGLQRGDRLVAVDGVPCAVPASPDAWRRALWAHGPVGIEFQREGGPTQRAELVP